MLDDRIDGLMLPVSASVSTAFALKDRLLLNTTARRRENQHERVGTGALLQRVPFRSECGSEGEGMNPFSLFLPTTNHLIVLVQPQYSGE